MSHTTYSLTLSCLFVCAAPFCHAAEEQDKYEEQTVNRCVEKAQRGGKNERGNWLKVLETAYPDKVVSAITDEEYGTWFTLLAGKNEEWRRDDSTSPAITELFDKVLQRLELGPVPSIKRDEYMRYARRLKEGNPPVGANAPDPNEDADKVFRVLDRDGNGELDREEFTSGLKDDKLRTDADGNGRITKEEYRDYFDRKVTTKVATTIAVNKGDSLVRGPDGKARPGPGNGLPDWFRTLDTDKDGQIALHEWRKGGKVLTLYTEMDLNADGLLTRDEYLRYVKMNEDKQKQEKREEMEK